MRTADLAHLGLTSIEAAWRNGTLFQPRDRDGAAGGDANAAPVPQDRHARAEGIAPDTIA